MARRSGFRIEVQLYGINQAIRDIKLIADPKRRISVMRRAIAAGGRVLLRDIRRRMRRHDRTGWLRKNMIQKLKFYRKQNVLVLIIGVKSNASTTVMRAQRFSGTGPPYIRPTRITAHKYAHFVFFGRKQFIQTLRFTNKNGVFVSQARRIGSVKGDNVIQQSVHTRGEEALRKMTQIVINDIVSKGAT